jgi:hypothetical protein
MTLKVFVGSIFESGNIFNIEGRVGTGKWFMVSSMIKEVEYRNRTFKAMAPTNQAARNIAGEAIHKFIARFNTSEFKNCHYIFIDEISMTHEVFYEVYIYV